MAESYSAKPSSTPDVGLDDLPPDSLVPIVTHLDPKSAVALMDSSSVFRNNLEFVNGVWTRLADLWSVPRDSALRFPATDDGRTVAHRIVTLDENLASKKCRVWKFEEGAPHLRLVEENNLPVEGTKPHKPIPGTLAVDWNGYFAATRSNSGGPTRFWNTFGFETPVLLDFTLPACDNPGFKPLTMWKNYVLVSPDSKVEGNGLLVLKIYDLNRNVEDANLVVVHSGDLELTKKNLGPCVDILETPSGEAKAIVFHRRIRSTVFVINLPKGTLERKIHLPGRIKVSRFEIKPPVVSSMYVNGVPSFNPRRPYFKSGIVYFCKNHLQCLSIIATDSVKTTAILEKFQNDLEDIQVTPNGATIALRRGHAQGGLYGPNGEDRLGFSASGPVSVEVPPGCVLNARGEPCSLSLLRGPTTASEGDLHLKVEKMRESEATISLQELAHLHYGTKVSPTANVVIVHYQTSVHVVKYKLEPLPELELMYKIDARFHSIALGASADRFLAVPYDELAPTLRLSLHSIKDGEMLAEKQLLDWQTNNAEFTCDGMATDTDMFLAVHEKEGKVFYLFKYL